MKRASLGRAFLLAQLISSIIAAYGDWGFSQVKGVSGGYIGITWIWNIIWFLPLDLVKFSMRFLVQKYNAARGKGQPSALKHVGEDGVPITRTQSRTPAWGARRGGRQLACSLD
ncbi:hypothetical protein MNV49_004344 [Pseudohyphozyma bogoriensis]|nr:hypothetical protein MNV49_004344 [Pseudohyphozyma bogoriensis]